MGEKGMLGSEFNSAPNDLHKIRVLISKFDITRGRINNAGLRRPLLVGCRYSVVMRGLILVVALACMRRSLLRMLFPFRFLIKQHPMKSGHLQIR